MHLLCLMPVLRLSCLCEVSPCCLLVEGWSEPASSDMHQLGIGSYLLTQLYQVLSLILAISPNWIWPISLLIANHAFTKYQTQVVVPVHLWQYEGVLLRLFVQVATPDGLLDLSHLIFCFCLFILKYATMVLSDMFTIVKAIHGLISTDHPILPAVLLYRTDGSRCYKWLR